MYKDLGIGYVFLVNNDDASKVENILNAYLITGKSGLKTTKPIAHKLAKIDPKIYDEYIGRYEINHETIVTVTREGDKLMAAARLGRAIRALPRVGDRFLPQAEYRRYSNIREGPDRKSKPRRADARRPKNGGEAAKVTTVPQEIQRKKSFPASRHQHLRGKVADDAAQHFHSVHSYLWIFGTELANQDRGDLGQIRRSIPGSIRGFYGVGRAAPRGPQSISAGSATSAGLLCPQSSKSRRPLFRVPQEFAVQQPLQGRQRGTSEGPAATRQSTTSLWINSQPRRAGSKGQQSLGSALPGWRNSQPGGSTADRRSDPGYRSGRLESFRP